MTRIALFGGSFNPPHVAHQMGALYVLETQPVDQLWIAPTFVHPFEHKRGLISFEHRVAMCKLMAEPLGPRVIVTKIEEEMAQRPGFRASRTNSRYWRAASPPSCAARPHRCTTAMGI